MEPDNRTGKYALRAPSQLVVLPNRAESGQTVARLYGATKDVILIECQGIGNTTIKCPFHTMLTFRYVQPYQVLRWLLLIRS
jgi:hypothetical protein